MGARHMWSVPKSRAVGAVARPRSVRRDEKGAISDGLFLNDERVRCVPHPILPGAEEARCEELERRHF